MKSRLLDWFSKNPTKRVFLIFFIRTPNLSKILNPQEICRDNFCFFMYISIYGYNVYYILKWRKLKDTFGYRPTRPVRPVRPSHQTRATRSL